MGGDKIKYEEVVEEGRDPRVPRSKGPLDQVSYLKVTFKYELDSKEGPSCDVLRKHSIQYWQYQAGQKKYVCCLD